MTTAEDFLQDLQGIQQVLEEQMVTAAEHYNQVVWRCMEERELISTPDYEFGDVNEYGQHVLAYEIDAELYDVLGSDLLEPTDVGHNLFLCLTTDEHGFKDVVIIHRDELMGAIHDYHKWMEVSA